MWDKIAGFFGGNLFGEIKDVAMAYFPPDQTPNERAEAELKFQDFLHKKEMDGQQVLNDASKQLDKRIADQEGTAKDLKELPVIGRLVLFLRGVQRPAWGFFAMYLDYTWFTKPSMIVVNDELISAYTEQQQTALIVINILVLGFLFGERTIHNLTPLIIKVFGGKT